MKKSSKMPSKGMPKDMPPKGMMPKGKSPMGMMPKGMPKGPHMMDDGEMMMPMKPPAKAKAKKK